jgi:ppGpp synthetase/RelA/SpoT-type nucleotidyltranferase
MNAVFEDGEPEMAWTEPQFTREQVNAAGRALVAIENRSDVPDWNAYHAYAEALPVVNNFRSSHSYPLNTFQVTLRNYARKIDPNCIVAQRTKRLSSIELKLRRHRTMKLSQMQDLGGCRAIVRSVKGVRDLQALYKASGIKHELASMDDYISVPKESGYRGVHLVYKYMSDKPKKKIYNGLKIEIQLRSQYQHAWATAVETVGMFVQQALKSSLGEPDWLKFFSLMGTAIANRERTAPVPNTPTQPDKLISELRHYSNTLSVKSKLTAFSGALRTLGTGQPGLELAHFYLLELDPVANELTVTGFRAQELSEAADKYAEAEKRVAEKPGTDAVLVSVDSLNALERAYPNYFADTGVFLQLMEQALTDSTKRINIPKKIFPSSAS